MESAVPERQGLYDPANEHDACGVGFVAHFKGQKSHSIVEQGLLILKNLDPVLSRRDGKAGHRLAAIWRVRRRYGVPAAGGCFAPRLRRGN